MKQDNKEKLKVFKQKDILKVLNEKIKIHTQLLKEICGNKDYHIGVIDELNRLKLIFK